MCCGGWCASAAHAQGTGLLRLHLAGSFMARYWAVRSTPSWANSTCEAFNRQTQAKSRPERAEQHRCDGFGTVFFPAVTAGLHAISLALLTPQTDATGSAPMTAATTSATITSFAYEASIFSLSLNTTVVLDSCCRVCFLYGVGVLESRKAKPLYRNQGIEHHDKSSNLVLSELVV